ncbi:MAG TPA: hypothetical protein VH592_06660 [Gemmataceae bacterium]
MIESALSHVGVTKERITKWFSSCFGCPARQKVVSDLHQWALPAVHETEEIEHEMLGKLIRD